MIVLSYIFGMPFQQFLALLFGKVLEKYLEKYSSKYETAQTKKQSAKGCYCGGTLDLNDYIVINHEHAISFL